MSYRTRIFTEPTPDPVPADRAEPSGRPDDDPGPAARVSSAAPFVSAEALTATAQGAGFTGGTVIIIRPGPDNRGGGPGQDDAPAPVPEEAPASPVVLVPVTEPVPEPEPEPEPEPDDWPGQYL